MRSKILELQKKLQQRTMIFMDGGMGSEIQIRGVKTALPLWSADALLTDPHVVQEIHEDNIRAGADILITNTFRTTKRAFEKKNISEQARDAAILACQLAKQAIKKVNPDRSIYIAGSIAPLEECYSPELTPPQSEVETEHIEIVQDLKDGGADFILFETMITLREIISGLQAAKKVGIPAAVSFCVNDKFQLLSGESLDEVMEEVEKYHPIFVGVNCISLPIATMTVPYLKKLTELPISVYAQGDGETDKDEGWKIKDKNNKQHYIAAAKQWATDGATIIGGCCGTSPDYISSLRKSLE